LAKIRNFKDEKETTAIAKMPGHQKNRRLSSCFSCHNFRCAFLRKLSGCVSNMTAFCAHLLKLIKSVVLADTDILLKPKYWP